MMDVPDSPAAPASRWTSGQHGGYLRPTVIVRLMTGGSAA